MPISLVPLNILLLLLRQLMLLHLPSSSQGCSSSSSTHTDTERTNAAVCVRFVSNGQTLTTKLSYRQCEPADCGCGCKACKLLHKYNDCVQCKAAGLPKRQNPGIKSIARIHLGDFLKYEIGIVNSQLTCTCYGSPPLLLHFLPHYADLIFP
jgi:hypothetical protein